jgi:hypothetical protein
MEKTEQQILLQKRSNYGIVTVSPPLGVPSAPQTPNLLLPLKP